MSITHSGAAVLISCWFGAGALADEAGFGFGRDATESELGAANVDIRFDGTGLPTGRGTAVEGATTYRAKCASCHGANLEGNQELWVRPLLGDARHAVNNLPFAPPLYAYVRRAMPLLQPGSLSDDEVYGLVAFLLQQAGVVSGDQVSLDAAGLAAIKMPNNLNFGPAEASGVKLPAR